MVDLKGLLDQLPWFKKVLDLANTLSPDVPAPWKNELLPGDVVIDTFPENLRNITVADFFLRIALEQKVDQHIDEHDNCSFACAFIVEVLIQHNERLILKQLFESVLARSLPHIQGIPFRILSDWRMVTTLETTTADPFEDFSEKNIPPPTDEEKRHEGS